MDASGSDEALAETERAARQLKIDVKHAKRRAKRLVAVTRAKLRRAAAKARRGSEDSGVEP